MQLNLFAQQQPVKATPPTKSPEIAARSFIGALEKIPSLIDKYQAENDKISKDIPILQEIVNSVWRKENELKNLKTELDVLDRKIQLSLKPIDQSEDKPEEKKDNNHTHKVSTPQEKRELTEEDKAIRDIQNLMSGKLSVKDFSQICKETQNSQSPKDEKNVFGNGTLLHKNCGINV